MSGVKTVVKENKYYVLWFSLHTAKVYLILPINIWFWSALLWTCWEILWLGCRVRILENKGMAEYDVTDS